MRSLVCVTLAFSLACSKGEVPAQAAAAASPSSRQELAVSSGAEDPEPPDAQARAEAVLHEPFNAGKTTRLVMSMTTIVGQTSSLQGIGTQLAAREEKIEDKLTRLSAKVTDAEVVIQLPGAILFDFDSARIRPDAERTLTDVAQVIASYAKRPVRIEGHTDSVASDDYNRTLSERRAASVVDWLAAHGADRSRITAAGLGESKPVATNETAAGRQLNRRVEVVIARK